ncbi:putative RNA-directed DNA polymerase [Helianthus annuus]|nr:putative RNA-directed DNA polymerase [Helianthus annuus]
MDLFWKKLSLVKANNMIRLVTDDEIKDAMFSIAGNKAPGPDGYTSVFFKKVWDVVGKDVCLAVKEFCQNGKLLNQLNHMVISLIPKVKTPDSVMDYRPISCCNTLYKCISKIITTRIKEGLGDIVNINQSAFIPGRKISDNILLTQELMHNYHLNHGPPRCAFKVDIQKAYDTVDWGFFDNILRGFGFHQRMIKWVMACVTSTMFSLSINGNLHGYFKGKRGLRQGDPMSPYLFTLVMEVLTLILQKQVDVTADFRFHHKCEEQRIINLCFADDLFLFARGDPNSAAVILKSLNLFKNMSGLVPSMTKSTVFFGGVLNYVKDQIRNIMQFDEGVLPVRYLGVPLISSRLIYSDCKKLVDNLESRITDWKAKSLSFAGCLQLIRSVLSAMHVYWSSVFILPKRIIHDLEDRMRRFLWAQGNNIMGKAKVKWSHVYLPKEEGGLGIRRISDMNNALMVAHIWSLLTHRESLWVKWVHSYLIRDRSFWDVPVRNNITWGWRKMLQLRTLIRQHIWIKLGNGANTLVWFNTWDTVCPLNLFITPRMISNAGFDMRIKVADMVQNGVWGWPNTWVTRFPILQQLSNVTFDPHVQDRTIWRSTDGKDMEYNTYGVWNDIRQVQNRVVWDRIVWFPQAIPRHSFLVWLIVCKKLKTQDIMCKWRSSGNANYNLVCCSLCTSGPDSHEHLFFECDFASQVWYGVREKADMQTIWDKWDDIMDHLLQHAESKRASHIIGKLVVAASAYFIWQERNNRLFSLNKRSATQVMEVILMTVRMKLHTMKFRRTSNVSQVLSDWSLSLVSY